MRYLFPEICKRGGLAGMLGASFPAVFLLYVVCAAISYLLGSVNTAVIISKKVYGYDIRDYGSGNAGMTNMFRSFGKKAGYLTLAGDALKSALALAISFFILGDTVQYISGFFAIVGHVFPIWHKFKGGKGVVVSAITILFIDPLVFAVELILFAMMFFTTKIISVGSITAAFFYPMIVYAFHKNAPDITYVLFAFFIGAFIIVMHKDNIIRLKNGEEKKLEIGKKSDKNGK